MRSSSLPTIFAIAAASTVLAAATGCDRPDVDDAAPAAAAAAMAQPQRIDSILPIEEEVRRFRAALPASATQLAGGATSIDELVTRYLAALEARDVAALGQLAITPAEFIDLYYPHTRYTSRPYELSPSIVWFQLENHGSKGLGRALARYGGKALASIGHVCPDVAESEGPNRVWSGCLVRRIDEAGDTVNVSLFGAILERDGTFKLVSHANRL